MNGPRASTKASRHLPTLSSGSQLYKLKSDGKLHKRTFRMDHDYLTLRQVNTKKFFRKIFGMDLHIPAISLNDIQDVREGAYTDTFIKNYEDLKLEQDQCLSVVYGAKQKSMDLIADNKDLRDTWFFGLRHLMKKYKQADLITQQDIWMREIFKKADKNNDGVLSLKEIVTLLKELNIEIDFEHANEAFRDANMKKEQNGKGEDVLDLDEFIRFYQVMTLRPEIEEIFESYNFEGKYLTADELQRFLVEEQKMTDVNLEDCKRMIDDFEPVSEIKNQHMLGKDGFNALLNSGSSSIFNINHAEVYQDMTQPLSHYWIDSSHNTYLIADQLVGQSRVEAYINALKMGCRCVELDCWGDDDDEDPYIYHGYTLTSKINFKDVIEAISKYAFEKSNYPVILSLENHCSVPQQKKMAEYLKSILGEKLLTVSDSNLVDLPSPEQLKGKILVKGKHIPASDDNDGEVSDEDEAADIDSEEVKKNMTKKKKENMKLAGELSELAIHCQSVSFKGFEHAMNNYNCNQMSSFGESKALSLASDSPSEYVEHNTKFLSRTYPGGSRTDSSNYYPMEMWNVGCQIVALNYQTSDEPMLLYKGRFRDNGGCGYVLKPPFMRKLSTEGTFMPKGPYPVSWKRKLTIKVISAYQLPKKKKDSAKSILDPYVKIEINGVESDHHSEKTEYIHNNGFNPVWNEVKEFVVNVPDLAIVSFYVHDYESYSSNVMVAQFCLPFTSLREGYCNIPLHDTSEYPHLISHCYIFVHVDITKDFRDFQSPSEQTISCFTPPSCLARKP